MQFTTAVLEAKFIDRERSMKKAGFHPDFVTNELDKIRKEIKDNKKSLIGCGSYIPPREVRTEKVERPKKAWDKLWSRGDGGIVYIDANGHPNIRWDRVHAPNTIRELR